MKKLIYIILLHFVFFFFLPESTTSDLFGQTNFWQYKTSMPTAKTLASANVINDTIYIVGGMLLSQSAVTSVDTYDPLTDSWSSVTDIPGARCTYMSCTFDGKIYIFGGCTSLTAFAKRSTFMYDPQTQQWTLKSLMPFGNSGAGVAVVDSLIYLFGGAYSISSPVISTVLVYNPNQDSWAQLDDMPSSRALLSCSVVNGKIYVIGGTTEDYNNVFYKKVEMFDPSTNTWITKADMPTGRWGLVTCVVEGKIYAIGGRAGSNSTPVNEVYNPATNEWITKAPMQQDRNTPAAGVVNNKIYVVGGHEYPVIQILSSLEEYTPDITVIDPESKYSSGPNEFKLMQNYPNPFNPNTKINFSIPSLSFVALKVYDVLGNEIETLVNEVKPMGTYELTWYANNLPSGVYFYQLKAGGFVETKKMILLR